MKYTQSLQSKSLALFLIICLLIGMLSGCDISNKHVEMAYEDNPNEGITSWDDAESNAVTTWDTVDVVSWSEVDEYSDWVYSEILFGDITDEMPIVDCMVLDYKSNGQYFDGDKVYTLVGDQFDVNSFVSKYAVGTGVIVICVVLTVASAGISQPVFCFFAGAADASISMAKKGAAFGAATKAVISAIKSQGDFEEILYDSLEGSADGYMWGAVFGAITGGFNSKYCFTGDTLVLTDCGYERIDQIAAGKLVYSYDLETQSFDFKPVTQISTSETADIVRLIFEDEVIETTPNHPFLTSDGWVNASNLSIGAPVLSKNNTWSTLCQIELSDYSKPVEVFTLCVEDYHSFLIGETGLVVHNRCNPNEKYADSTRYFDEDSPLAKDYPNGVYIKPNGYPDFSPYAEITVSFDYPTKAGVQAGTCLRGDCYYDMKMANKAAFGIDSVSATPKGYTWHHVEDGTTMELIPTKLHRAIGHDGGEKVIAQILAA